jgi:8-oxo-dGTP diphosphatase
MRPEEVKFCPKCGTPISWEQRFGQERPICPACGFIYFADPKVAVAVLVQHEQRILLVRRANEPFRGLWTLPAGFVNGSEDPAQAAVRECMEETGLVVKVSAILDIHAGREHARGSDFIVFYRAEVAGGTLLAGDDADAAEWFERGGLPGLAFKSTKTILEQF